jgi:hypothetical protein
MSSISKEMNLKARVHLSALVDIFTKALESDPDNGDAREGKRCATYWLEDVNKALNQ